MKNTIRILALTFTYSLLTDTSIKAQNKLYPRLFDLQEVTLHDGIFKTAMDLNIQTLLQYDTDRLLTPYMRQAGFTEWETEHPNFSNWGSGNFRLDGHVGGHYLSALALAYAATKDEATRMQLKTRMDYIVDKMDECQRVFDENTNGLYGYIGGLPDNSVWTGIYKGDLTAYNNNRGNVPLYTIHKIYAGLRDAWVYGGNEKAKGCFLKLCDWGVNLISNINDNTLQSILDTEHGGINEMYVDAYKMTGKEAYLIAAHRYSHKTMIDNMQMGNHTFLDNKHANTQVPKYIGFARIAQEDDKSDPVTITSYRRAAHNFWKDVVNSRTVALGGNSISEHFLPDSRCSEYINHPDGPESCNTNNMMKLTEDLFADDQNTTYADFYEQAMLNHILSTQNPTTGGYVYFTSLRPQHYRMYSQVNQGMWCCVGTGMENHSKYGEFVYARSPKNDTLYVNLFVASTLNNEIFGITQSTSFPYEEETTLTIDKDGEYVLALRKPQWCKTGFSLEINGNKQNSDTPNSGYIYVKQSWKTGDKIVIKFPMQLELTECPNYTNYVAFKYGPVLLGAITSTENLVGQFAGEGRMDHAPSQGTQLSLTSAPMLIGKRENVLDSVYMVSRDKLTFKIRTGLYNSKRFSDLILQPFFTIHEARYMMYWNQMTQEEWDAIKDEVIAEEQIMQHLNERTLDFVATGEQQSDAGHVLQGDFEKGSYSGEFYIDALSGKWFSYQLATQGIKEKVSLMCRYHSADAGRIYTLSINGHIYKEIRLEPRLASGFYNVEYLIPEEMLEDKDGNVTDSITIKFEATGSTATPGIYYLRLLKEYEGVKPYSFTCYQWKSGDAARVNKVEYNRNANTIKVYGKPGENNIALQFNQLYDDSTFIKIEQKYFLVKGKNLKTGPGLSYLWWLNGANHGTQIAPKYTVTNTNAETFVIWDIQETGLADNIKSDSVMLSSYGKSFNTVFGLTSSAEDNTAEISDIGFYSLYELLTTYPELKSTLKFNVLDENSPIWDIDNSTSIRNILVIKDIKANEWTALCLPFDIGSASAKRLFSQIKKYKGYAKTENGILQLYFTDADNIEEGGVYLVKSSETFTSFEIQKRISSAETKPAAIGNEELTVQGTYIRQDGIPYSLTYESEKFKASEHSFIKGLGLYVLLNDESWVSADKVAVSFDEMPDAISETKINNETISIYTVSGIKIGEARNKTYLKTLPNGIYILKDSTGKTNKRTIRH